MRIAIGTTTRFHMLDLARELRRLGEDTHVFTALPPTRVDSELRDCTRTHPSRLVAWRLSAYLPLLRDLNVWENATFRDFGSWFGRMVSRADIDVLDALDCIGFEAGRAVQRRGGIWILNRGSAHILTQKELVTAEHARWKQPIPKTYFHPYMVDRGLAEYEAADAIVVPSCFARRSFLERGFDPETVHLCPYGVDITMFHPEPRADRRFRLLFVGAQSIRKGIGYLFEALRPLIRSGAVELWLVGPTPDDGKEILRQNADLFVHHGVQSRSRLSWFYSQADALVLPSVEEGLALVQAQAMACGTPVIASVNTGAEDLFTDGVEGFIVPPRDPVAIRDRVQRLLDEPALLQRMKSAALDRVQSLGGWSRYGQTARQMYRRVIQRRGATLTPSVTSV
jgi:glycosyltransferase involved in cell wall biosynthesis